MAKRSLKPGTMLNPVPAVRVSCGEGDDANIIFGATASDDLQDEMRVTVIATGFEPKEEPVFAAPQTVAGEAPAAKPADVGDIDEIFKIFGR